MRNLMLKIDLLIIEQKRLSLMLYMYYVCMYFMFIITK